MGEQNLYDLSPAVQLMIMGLIVAAAPLAWVWLRSRGTTAAQRLLTLTLVTLFFTFDLVLFGAFTRLTDSGLGCPDWPGCYGHASPVGAQMYIDAAQRVLPAGPVTHPKAWIEMIHRYLATGVGVMILTLAVLTWLERRRILRTSSNKHAVFSNAPVWWAAVTLAWVCLQGAFGALTVTMKLFPAIVTLHLLGGLVLLALLKAQSQRQTQAPGGDARKTLARSTRSLLLACFALLWLQIALGGWVSTNYAVLACNTFPSCQGSFWPAMDFSQGFTLWRALGAAGGDGGGNITFQALTAIHYAHRLAAYVVLAALLTLAARLYRLPSLRGQARWLFGLSLLQGATGLANVVLGWPLAAAVAHTGGAAALVMVLTGLVFSSRSTVLKPAAAGAPKLQGARGAA